MLTHQSITFVLETVTSYLKPLNPHCWVKGEEYILLRELLEM